jgi:rod shape-determining protein MreD
MVSAWIGPLWMHRLLFLTVATLLMFFRLLPLNDVAGQLPGPDILLCMIFAWTVRRPEYLPVLMIAAVVLLEDLLLMRPPGLWTGLVIVASEFIRSRVALTRELSFGVEWLLVAGLMVAVFLGYRLAMSFAFLPQPAFGFALVQILWSVVAYPFVVALSRYGLDLHKPATGETDAYGRRL